MTAAVKENQNTYLSSFAQLEKKLPGSGQAWLDRIRKEAIQRFTELGFPTTHDEEWKYTSVAPISRIAFQPRWAGGSQGSAVPIAEELRGSALADLQCSRIVFVNGRYSPELSKLEALPQGVKAGYLASALGSARNGAGFL